MNIIFMGSPFFACPAFMKLVNSSHNILAVYTQAPKPAGRGHHMSYTPIYKLAKENNLEIRTPKSLRKQPAIDEFKAFNADLVVVVAYGLILPKEVLYSSKYGSINIHPSRLPKFRGAAPIQRTILSGDKESAVCIIKMDEGIDTGPILAQRNVVFPDDITSSKFHDEASVIGAELLFEVIENIDNIKPMEQIEENISYADKIQKEEGLINWKNDDASFIDRKIRALNPFPGTYFYYMNQLIKVKSVQYLKEDHDFAYGTVVDNNLTIACKGGFVRPLILQREGKKEMDFASFLNGFNIEKNTILS